MKRALVLGALLLATNASAREDDPITLAVFGDWPYSLDPRSSDVFTWERVQYLP